MDLLNGISNAVSNAADKVADAARVAANGPLIAAIEKEIEQYIGWHVDIELRDVPESWEAYMTKTGLNSIAVDDSWSFLENTPGNARKIELWKQRGIKKIYLQAWDNVDEEDRWIDTEVEWESGWDYFIVWFTDHSRRWSSDRTWVESGYKRWWNLSDDIVFGLQLYQLPGKCFYKSDWLEEFEDVDPDGAFAFSTKKFKRWFQFRHWIIFWYPEARSGYNWQWTQTPPKLPDGSLFSLDAVLKLPSMPDLTLPSIKLPSLPDVSMPTLPSVDMPSISAPSLSAPSLSMPSLGSLPSMPDKKVRPTGKWDAHGFIELEGLNVKASGSKLILSDANITHFWKDGAHHVENEKKEHQRLELVATSAEQAQSWVESLVASGCKEGEVGGCCVVA